MSFIIEGLRVPTGKAYGYYKSTMPEILAAHLLKEFRQRYPFLEQELDEVIMGNAIGTGGNMARYESLAAGFSVQIPATTVDMQCGSSQKAILMGDSQIKSRQSKCVLVGGMESNSLSPKRQYQPRDPRFVDENTFYTRASFAPENDIDLKESAENLAHKYQISKDEMLDWTLRSHELATKADLSSVILPFGDKVIDQTLRRNLSFEQLQKTQSDCLIDHTNTAHLHDGAGAMLLASKEICEKYNLKAKAKICESVIVGGLPQLSPMGAIWAAEALLKKTNLTLNDIDLIEVNESFAVKPLAFMKHFGISAEKLNIFGGNLAFGHPFGASGTINLLHLISALEQKNKKRGLFTAGIAGGLGCAILVERV